MALNGRKQQCMMYGIKQLQENNQLCTGPVTITTPQLIIYLRITACTVLFYGSYTKATCQPLQVLTYHEHYQSKVWRH